MSAPGWKHTVDIDIHVSYAFAQSLCANTKALCVWIQALSLSVMREAVFSLI